MTHVIAVVGLVAMVVVWYLLQRATGTTETAGRGRCGGCGCGGQGGGACKSGEGDDPHDDHAHPRQLPTRESP
jgi:hypothetical protein